MARLRVKEIADQQGVKAIDIVRKTDIAYSVVLKMFRDPNYNVTTDTLQKVAQVLGVTVKDLFEDEKPPS